MATVPANQKNYAFFERFSNNIINWVGSSAAFLLAGLIVIVWAIMGPIMHYSDVWQLIINTITSIATFLMVFVIQKSQNKDSKAIQLKLDELIAANRFASNRMVNIEDLTEEELDELRKFYTKLSTVAAKNVTKKKITFD